MSLYTVQRSLLRGHLALRYTLTSIVLAHCYHVVQLFIYWEIIQKLYCSVIFNSKNRSGLLIIVCIIFTTIVRIYIGVLICICISIRSNLSGLSNYNILFAESALFIYPNHFVWITDKVKSYKVIINMNIYMCVYICIIQTNTINTGKVFFLCNSIVTVITCITMIHCYRHSILYFN